MDQKAKSKELEAQTKETALTQTELDLANAVVLIQEREAELARVRKEREQLFTAHSQEMTRADQLAIELDQAKQAADKPKPAIPKTVYNTTVPNLALTAGDADNSDTATRATSAGFGTKFPDNPGVGDLFLRVDMLPNKLYKWNGKKWIEIEKTTTDRYVYEEEYIKYITDKVSSGEYDFQELSKEEQEEVLSRLDYNTKSKL